MADRNMLCCGAPIILVKESQQGSNSFIVICHRRFHFVGWSHLDILYGCTLGIKILSEFLPDFIWLAWMVLHNTTCYKVPCCVLCCCFTAEKGFLDTKSSNISLHIFMKLSQRNFFLPVLVDWLSVLIPHSFSDDNANTRIAVAIFSKHIAFQSNI